MNVIADRFEVEAAVATGGMGTVYRARDRQSGQLVALKLLRHDGIREDTATLRFEREATVLSQLSHPNIVEYVARGTTPQGEPYLVMEWLEGEDLGKTLRRGPLDVASTVIVGEAIARGLACAHEHGILHRDLKPANVFFAGGDLARAKVIDFGLARILGAGTETLSGALMGTPGYMAPEQVRDVPDLDARVDVFALGCVLFKCLTGRGPFAASDPTAALAKVLYDDAPRLSEQRPDVPPFLDALVTSMLAKAREERPASGADVAAALGSAIRSSQLPPAAPALTRAEKRVISVVLAGRPSLANAEAEKTLKPTAEHRDVEALRAAVAPFGAELDVLPNGNVVATLLASRAATDQASRAARCALAIRDALPKLPIAIAMGRSEIGRRLVGDVIDRATSLLGGEGAHVAIDDLTAGLLDARFDVGGQTRLELHGMREVEATRTLLGRTTDCVGREREIAALVGVLDEALETPAARTVVLTASAGMGKSRLRYELFRKVRARASPPDVWLARCDPLSAGSPFAMIGALVRRAAGIREGEPLAVRQRKLRARVARNVGTQARAPTWPLPTEADVPRLTEFLGELVGSPFDDADSVQLRTARLTPLLLGDQMKRAFCDFLAAECAAQPLCLVFEDLHWGDRPSVAFVDAALRVLRDAPLFVLGLARPEVDEAFPNLWADREAMWLRLGPLSKRASERMVHDVLGDKSDASTASRLAQLASGNAFYLEELIRAVAEARASGTAGAESARLPETVLAMAQARLESLGDDERHLLRAASVFGQSFWREALPSLLGSFSVASVLKLLRTLTEKELVARRPETRFPNADEYVFRHALVREAAYAMLTEEDRALGHRLAGEWLERSGETDALILAEHTERGGDRERARAHYRRAAEEALSGNDFAGAVNAALAAERCGADGPELAEVRVIEAEAKRWLGEAPRALELAAQAAAALPVGSHAWFRAAGEIAGSSTPSGRVDVLESVYEALLAAVEQAPLSGVVAGARASVALLLAGRNDAAAALGARTSARASALGDEPVARGADLQARAMQALVAGDAAEHVALVEAAAESFERGGDLRSASLARVNAGYGMMMLGDPRGAAEKLRAALAWSEPMGLGYVTSAARHNLGLALAHNGELVEAIAAESQAIQDAVKLGDRRLEGASRTYLAIMLADSGELEAAEREVRLAIQLLQVAAPVRVHALGTLARVLVLAGRKAEALEVARDGMATLEGIGDVEEGEALMRLSYAQALEANGDVAGARRESVRARDKVLQSAGKIRDAQTRERFLHAIPEHRRTLEMVARLESASDDQ